jgi:hypothetical protein
MSQARLFAERFLVPVRDDPEPEPAVRYDETRAINVTADGRPVVELGTEQTKTYEMRSATFQDADESCGGAWARTNTNTFIQDVGDSDPDHHTWAGTITNIRGPTWEHDT